MSERVKGGGSAGNLKGCILQMLADDTDYERGGGGGQGSGLVYRLMNAYMDYIAGYCIIAITGKVESR
jgi:hypothetical protein